MYNGLMNIDIEKVALLKDELRHLKEGDVAFVNENGIARYVIMPVDMYDSIEDVMALIDGSIAFPQVKLAGDSDIELSYEEYERIKKQIIDALEKTLMPKPEKLN